MSECLPELTDPYRRKLLRFAGGASLILLVTPLAQAGRSAGPSVLAVRVWPAADYTRVTLESDAAVKFSQFTVKNPERLVVDLEGVELQVAVERRLVADGLAQHDAGAGHLVGGIAQSCSVYFYEAGYRMGAEPMIKYSRDRKSVV